MNPKERAAHRLALAHLRTGILATGPAPIEPNRRDPATTGVSDEDAQALSEMMQVLASERNKGQTDLLARVDRALRRLDTAPLDYGMCEECEEPIAAKRLALMPYATRCAACQAKAEPRHTATRKKLTDYR